MVFTSFNFLIFFPAVILLYYASPAKYKTIMLLFASYFFYLNLQPVYVLLLITVSLTTYLFAKWISISTNEKKKQQLVTIGVVVVLLPLFFFKYFSFAAESIASLLVSAGIHMPLPKISFLLPIGISFYTFMAIGYLVDVQQETVEAERNPVIVALFLSFFPILLSGPIERAGNMFPQFKSKRTFKAINIEKGLKLMLWGYFMKMVVADRIALLVGAIMHNPEMHSGASLFMAVMLYPIQVYGDLGGYSLIAIGAAKTMGIEVVPNFRRPFFSTSMSEFWRRWHISLISWITDYIYIPLSYHFRKYKLTGIVMAIMITFLVAGIWHGAGIIFIIWGLIQGTILSIEAVTKAARKKIINRYALHKKTGFLIICMLFVYFLFAFSEIFGGATSSMDESMYVINKIAFEFNGPLFYDSPSLALFIIIGVSLLFFVDWCIEFNKPRLLLFNSRHIAVRTFGYSCVVILIILIGVLDGGQFIYFKF